MAGAAGSRSRSTTAGTSAAPRTSTSSTTRRFTSRSVPGSSGRGRSPPHNGSAAIKGRWGSLQRRMEPYPHGRTRAGTRVLTTDAPPDQWTTMTIRPFDIRASRRADDGVALGGAIRVLVVDDHAAVRMGLGGALEDHSDLTVVATAAGAREALADAAPVAPVVAVVDYHLDDGDGLTLCRALK